MIELGGYRPGCLADIVACHARYYAANWDFGRVFEAKVAGELAAFATRMRPDEDLLLVAYEDDRFAGSIVIDASDADPRGAHLRWFIVAQPGRGLGRRLIQSALAFLDAHHHANVWLTTFSGLDAARRLYEEHGFKLVEESAVDQWQGGVREQLFERRLSGNSH